MKLTIFIFVYLLFICRISYTQDNIHYDIRSFYNGKAFPESEFYTPGDSCNGTGSERHDGYTHANGMTAFTDSVRIVSLFHPSVYPWHFTKVCIGWTSIGGVANLNYCIVMYDSSASGKPGNLLYVSPVQTASTVPGFPLMNWYSSVLSLPQVVSGGVYIGIRYDNNPATNCYLSMDESAGTPYWPNFYATDITYPPVWIEFINVPPFQSYRCAAIRTEGQHIVGINSSNESIPLAFVLHQNYPNPFNPSTKIHFEIPANLMISLFVYDSRGSLLEKLIDKELRHAGSFDFEFDGTNLPSGVYFYRMQTESFSVSRKMVLVK